MDRLSKFLQGFSRLAGAALGAAYVVLGGFVIFARTDFLQLGGVLRYSFGGLLIIYGIYRIARSIKNPAIS